MAAALDCYLRSLEPLPSPKLEGGRLSPAAHRGETIFRSSEVGCANCHSGGLRTDLKAHDVGTTGRFDQGQVLFDTPALVELWRTAPFLHDGSCASLHELVTSRNRDDRHGRTSHLSKAGAQRPCRILAVVVTGRDSVEICRQSQCPGAGLLAQPHCVKVEHETCESTSCTRQRDPAPGDQRRSGPCSHIRLLGQDAGRKRIPSPRLPDTPAKALLDRFQSGPMAGVNEFVFAARKMNDTDGHWYANIGYYAHDPAARPGAREPSFTSGA